MAADYIVGACDIMPDGADFSSATLVILDQSTLDVKATHTASSEFAFARVHQLDASTSDFFVTLYESDPFDEDR